MHAYNIKIYVFRNYPRLSSVVERLWVFVVYKYKREQTKKTRRIPSHTAEKNTETSDKSLDHSYMNGRNYLCLFSSVVSIALFVRRREKLGALNKFKYLL